MVLVEGAPLSVITGILTSTVGTVPDLPVPFVANEFVTTEFNERTVRR